MTTQVQVKKVQINPAMTVSMRALAQTNNALFGEILPLYHQLLGGAFPDPAEYENQDTYDGYLHDRDFAWDMIVLRADDGRILGGIQYQVVEVGGIELKRAVWAEHIWLVPEARTFLNFRSLLNIAVERFNASGAPVLFMEFNDRGKMNLGQLNDDAAGGLATEDRERIWARVGLSILTDNRGLTAPYNQPGMDPEDPQPVTYLSLGFAPLSLGSLNHRGMLLSDYKALLRAAHFTIPCVDETDATVCEYSDELDARMEDGEDRFRFVKLADTVVTRIVKDHKLISGDCASLLN